MNNKFKTKINDLMTSPEKSYLMIKGNLVPQLVKLHDGVIQFLDTDLATSEQIMNFLVVVIGDDNIGNYSDDLKNVYKKFKQKVNDLKEKYNLNDSVENLKTLTKENKGVQGFIYQNDKTV